MHRSLVIALVTAGLLSAAVLLELGGLPWGGDERAEAPAEQPDSSIPIGSPVDGLEGPAEDDVGGQLKRLPSVTPEVPSGADASLPQAVAETVKGPDGPILGDPGVGESGEIRRLPPTESTAIPATELGLEVGVPPTSVEAGHQDEPITEPAPSQEKHEPTRPETGRIIPESVRPVSEAVQPTPEPVRTVAPSEQWRAIQDHALGGNGNQAPGARSGTSGEDLPRAGQDWPRESPAEASWWAMEVSQPQREGSRPQPLDLATLVQEAMLHSQYIQAISLEPQIRETEIIQQDAAFDPAAFIDSKWSDISDPVGNLLTTGGPPRLNRDEWTTNIGLRRKVRTGGKFEIFQKLAEEDNNSVFFVPANQATTRLTASFTQPLLKGGGRAYNRSLILLAQHDTQVARDQFQSDLENHVLLVVKAYWELYFQRAVLLQQKAALREAEVIRENMLGRESFDALKSQIDRVTSTVAIRRAGVRRAEGDTKKAEFRLRALTTSPLLGDASVELLPIEPPLNNEVMLATDVARRLALENRNEIDEALTEVRKKGVLLGVAKNEMLPSLGLVLESYVAGLEGAFDLPRSFGEQFSEGAPSYTVGINFEMQLGRRASRAVHRRRVFELQQAEHRLQQTIATLGSEVDRALVEVETTWQVLVAQRAAALATANEVRHERARLNLVPGEDQSVSFHLQELLDSIDRLVRDETALADAQRNYAVAIAEFHRATGMLVNVETGGP